VEKEKNYITIHGFEKLQKEHDELWKIERPKLTDVIRWAAANGDRSENSDYIYGKRRLREIDRRLRFLKKRMELAVIVKNREKGLLGKVQFGAKVTISDHEGVEKCYTIVGVDEIELDKKRISWKSPLGHSLMGKMEGDVVIFQSPKGEVEIEILKIEFGA